MSPTPQSMPEHKDALPDQAQARALSLSPTRLFLLAIMQSSPMLLVVGPFAVLFGVVATEAGLSLTEVMGFSVLVLAGASQFTAVQLMTDNVPMVLIILSALAVNLRMAMYSASLVPWLGKARLRDRMLVSYLLIDQTYALGIQYYERNPRLSMAQRLGYFFGLALTLCFPWALGTLIGATIGESIPDDYALDFALPITFLAMIAPMLRSLAHVAAAGSAIALALALAWMPSGLGLLIAAPIGMVVGAVVEIQMERRDRAAWTV